MSTLYTSILTDLLEARANLYTILLRLVERGDNLSSIEAKSDALLHSARTLGAFNRPCCALYYLKTSIEWTQRNSHTIIASIACCGIFEDP
jgi:hypothetical protein